VAGLKNNIPMEKGVVAMEDSFVGRLGTIRDVV
jgi:hypothetical protein